MRRFLFAALLAVAVPPSVVVHADDWDVVRNPFDPKVIAQYKGILNSNPHDVSAFAKLLELYRRYSTQDKLRAEYQAVLDKKADDWAALVVMARLSHATGDDAKALDNWTKAVAAKDTDAQSWAQIGELQKQAGKMPEAKAAYDKALAHAGNSTELKKKALRALADISLATNDSEGADKYFAQFLALDKNNAQLWIERGDAMLQAKKYDVARDSYSAAEKLLGSDPDQRMKVVGRRGQAFEEEGKDDEAVAEYRRAIAMAPKGYYYERELTGRIIDIYRKKQQLGQLLAYYEKQWPDGSRGYFEWDTLGRLYEETGAQDKAIAALKSAVGKDPTELETQRRLIQLLENSGRDDEAIAQYEKVIGVAPGDARFQIELAERYWRRGQEKKALDALVKLEQRFPNDPGVLGAIADMYTRWNKDDKAIEMYKRLAVVEPEDPSHLVALGEQYWQKGDKPKAMETWRKIVANDKAASWAKLGDVLNEHITPGQQPLEALKAYDTAISKDPKNPEYYKGRAAIEDAMKKYPDAIRDWEEVLSKIDNKPVNRISKREARRKLVGVILKVPVKENEYSRKWVAAFAKAQPDTDAGYFLVEYYTKRPTVAKDEPRKTLEKLTTLVPDDQDLVMDLVKAYRVEHKYDEAVARLLELAKQVPSRERDVYDQIADIKIEERKDDEATEWRLKALAKSPNNPQAYEKLAEGFVAMQQFGKAIEAYQETIKLDPTDSKAHFALAQLYVQGGQPDKAAALLRELLRNARDEEIVGRAGRQAIDLEEMTDTLGDLEKVISPLSFMMAHKPVYRRVLVDLYLRYVPKLVARERHGNDEVRKAARAELDRIGAHGLRPLLEALRDDKDQNQQRTAVQVLGHLGNKGAAAPLVHLARTEPPKDQRKIGTLTENVDREVRVDALVAAGRLGDSGVLDDVMPLLDHGEKSMREAATFTLGRSANKKAVAPLIKMLADHGPSVQVLACLGLAQVDDTRVLPALTGVLKDTTRTDAVRAACAYAIGARKLSAGTPALLAALDDNRGETQRLSAWALGQIGDAKALGPLIHAYFARTGGGSDEIAWAIGRVSGAGLQPAQLVDFGDYPIRGGNYNEHAAVADLPGTMPKAPVTGKLVVDHADDIAAGLKDALSEHRDVVVGVLADLDGSATSISLGALSPATTDAKVAAALASIAERIEPSVVAQLTSDDPKVRALALSVIAKMDGGKNHDADAAILKALSDPADQVRTAAMAAVAVVAQRRSTPPAELIAALVKGLDAPAWADRRAAALAIGKLGAAADVGVLAKAAGDPSSFVREAVAIALGDSGNKAAVEPLQTLAKDSVPQVRDAATAALTKLHG